MPTTGRKKWHLDAVFVKVNGERACLWRALDQDGDVLDILLLPGAM
ncbi:DDE-type integrase/transposase/recombinase [Streptomyces sp. CT34]|nr:DDE-type integrase/transposase/recombinase [Streptomyces sp. CT34]